MGLKWLLQKTPSRLILSPMALQSPGFSASSNGGPSGGINLRRPVGMDYTGKFRTGPANFRPGRGLSVNQILNQREGTLTPRYGDGSAVPTGMPINNAGWNVRGLRQGGPIGSAAGAVGSAGIPTSQRGRAENYGMDPQTGAGAWQYPAWMISEMQRNNGGGLSQSQNYGTMGQLPFEQGDPGGYGSGPIEQQPLAVDPFKRGVGLPKSIFGTGIQDYRNRQNYLYT